MSLETPSESNKILNEFPISHAIPFFPVISNSFSVPNDLSIYSSSINDFFLLSFLNCFLSFRRQPTFQSEVFLLHDVCEIQKSEKSQKFER